MAKIDRKIVEDPNTSQKDFEDHISTKGKAEWEAYVEGVLDQLLIGIGAGVGEYVDFDEVSAFVDGDGTKPGYRVHLRTFLLDYKTRLTGPSRRNLFQTALLMGQLAKLLAGSNKEVKFKHLQAAHRLVASPNTNPINCGSSTVSAPAPAPAPYCT